MASRGAPEPHGPIQAVAPDLFVVEGRFTTGPLHLTRNMIVVRQGAELTLVNGIRLSPAGEAALDALGEVRHLVRLGGYHGRDEPYLVARYGPVCWAPRDRRPVQAGGTEQALEQGTPIEGAEALVFQGTARPEGVLFLPHGGGTLLCCDSVQCWGDLAGCDVVSRMILRALRYPGPPRIGRGWRLLNEPGRRLTLGDRLERGLFRLLGFSGHPPGREGHSLDGDFRRILAWGFDNVLSGHGPPVMGGGKAALNQAFQASYPSADSG